MWILISHTLVIALLGTSAILIHINRSYKIKSNSINSNNEVISTLIIWVKRYMEKKKE